MIKSGQVDRAQHAVIMVPGRCEPDAQREALVDSERCEADSHHIVLISGIIIHFRIAYSALMDTGMNHSETRAVHAGRLVDAGTGAIALPIHLSTTFERDADGSYPRGYAYATFNNPNRAWLESAMAELEGGAAAVAAASGMGAIAAILSSLRSGDHILVSYDLFQGTARLLNDQVQRWEIAVDVADLCVMDEIEAALTPATRMIWIDTPSNPLLRIADIAKLAAFSRARGITLVVDSTFATFALQRPLELGADVAVYAATKYLGGHSDVVLGVAAFRDDGELYERARAFQVNVGVCPSPFDCWLVHRGLRTVPLRMRRHSKNAQAVAEFLQAHPAVSAVYYPGLPSHPGHETAKRQMPHGCGGMLSFCVNGGRESAIQVAASVKLFTRAASLGGVESLIEHRASSPIQTLGRGTGFEMPENLLRLSLGVEHYEDLIDDLDRALGTVEAVPVKNDKPRLSWAS